MLINILFNILLSKYVKNKYLNVSALISNIVNNNSYNTYFTSLYFFSFTEYN